MKKLLLIPFLFCGNVFALTVEDVIKKHNLDINKESDRCSMSFLIEHNYNDILHSKQVEFYSSIEGDYNAKINPDEITFRVYKDFDGKLVAGYGDIDRFYIIKLQNGTLIGNNNGYFVPFDYFEFFSKKYKTQSKIVIKQKNSPEKGIRHFHVEKCIIKIVN